MPVDFATALRRRPPRSALLKPNTIAAEGLAKGGRAAVPEGAGDAEGLRLRSLEPIPPLVSAEDAARAWEFLRKGNRREARQCLRHDDQASAGAFLAKWCEEHGLDSPPISLEDEPPLSEAALRRIRLKPWSPLPVALVLESGPGGDPSWGGMQFESGKALARELFGRALTASPGAEKADEADGQGEAAAATMSMVKENDEGEWLTSNSAIRKAEASGYEPAAVCELRLSERGSELITTFHDYRRWRDNPDDSLNCRTATVPRASKLSSSEPASILVAATDAVAPMAHDEPIEGLEGKTSQFMPMPVDGLFRPATKQSRTGAARSLVSKAIRRGRRLCGHEPLDEACEELLQAECAGDLAWTLAAAAAQDASPYLVETQSRGSVSPSNILTFEALIGLSLLAQAAGPSIKLPKPVAGAMKETAFRLQAHDRAGSLWPWRGWRSYEKAARASLASIEGPGREGPRAVRDALRCACIGYPAERHEKTAMMRLLGGLLEGPGSWAPSLPVLEPPHEHKKREDYAPEEAHPDAAEEARLCAMDHTVQPSSIVLLQASMPFPPMQPAQHSVRALVKLVCRLSSDVNVRTLKLKALGGSTQELFRIQQFANNASEAESDARVATASEESRLPVWRTSMDAMMMTEHEEKLLESIRGVQRSMKAAHESSPRQSMQQELEEEECKNLEHEARLLGPPKDNVRAKGRRPTDHESRAAFLILFGLRHYLDVRFFAADTRTDKELTTQVAASICGTPDQPLRVQRCGPVRDLSGKDVSLADDEDDKLYGGAARLHTFVTHGPVLDAALTQLVREFDRGGSTISVPRPPPGFRWRLGEKAELGIAFNGEEDGKLRFFVDGSEVAPFDVSPLLEANNAPAKVRQFGGRLERLVRQALYALREGEEAEVPEVELIGELQREAALRRRSDSEAEGVPEWLPIVMEDTSMPRHAWRDTLVKVQSREGKRVDIAVPTREGERASMALQQMSEGASLRILAAMGAMYPRVVAKTGEMRFEVDDGVPEFPHMHARISLSAMGCWDDGNRFHTASKSGRTGEFLVSPMEEESIRQSEPTDAPEPLVTTQLWPHQEEGKRRVMDGIKQGKRGFADASAVGAGKTLTAIATMMEAGSYLSMRGISRSGCLVLVPNKELIWEWAHQALVHTSGLKVLIQTASGLLISKGVSEGQSSDKSRRNRYEPAKIDGKSLVITTLSRAREHPFKDAVWDMTTVDECLSVQSCTAVQTMEAWRQVEASRLGVMMLSATFFRSSFAKLFYMIRMLRSPLPRTHPYLVATLSEHLIAYVPTSRRAWHLTFQPVHLPEDIMAEYSSLVSEFHRHHTDPRQLYSALKSLLKSRFDDSLLLNAFSEECSRLRKQGRRPVLFASSDNEAERLLNNIPDARTLGQQPTTEKAKRGSLGPLVVTVQRGAHGLNLQHEGDAIITRPAAGDVIEQMKGRIDRPGQAKKDLHMVILYASSTVEEAEASNVRLCGRFFREYIHPLSRRFAESAGDAALSAHIHSSLRNKPIKRSTSHVQGGVAAAFRNQLAETVEASENRGAATPSPWSSPKQEQPKIEHDDMTGFDSQQQSDSASGASPRVKQKDSPEMDPESIIRELEKLPDTKLQEAMKLLEGGQALREGEDGGMDVDFDSLCESELQALRSFLKAEQPNSVRTATAKNPSRSTNKKGKGSNQQKQNQKKRSSAKRKLDDQAADGTQQAIEEGTQGKSARKSSDSFSSPVSLKRRKALYSTVDDSGRQDPPTLAEIDVGEALRHLSEADPKIGRVITQVGPPTSLISRLGGDAFKALGRAIVYQQLSTIAASAIFKRVVQLCGGEENFKPDAIASQSEEDLRKAGLSKRKVEYLLALAKSFQKGDLSNEKLHQISDTEALDLLCSQKGIGEWFLMFNMGRTDVLPVTDLAVRKAFRRLYGVNGGKDESQYETEVAEHVNLPTREEMEEIAKHWRPFRTIGCWFCWFVLESDDATYTY